MDSRAPVRWTVTGVACVVLLVHLVWPQLRIDAVSFGLLLLACVPWLAPIIKSIEVPGVGKIELQAPDPNAQTLIRTIPAVTPQGQVEKRIPLADSNGFYTPEALRQLVADSDLLERDEEVVGQLEIFETLKQHTWLIATSRQLLCILDDSKTRSSGRLMQWRIPLDDARPVTARPGRRGGRVVSIGPKKGWYYSASLHPDIESEITELIDRARGTGRQRASHA